MLLPELPQDLSGYQPILNGLGESRNADEFAARARFLSQNDRVSEALPFGSRGGAALADAAASLSRVSQEH